VNCSIFRSSCGAGRRWLGGATSSYRSSTNCRKIANRAPATNLPVHKAPKTGPLIAALFFWALSERPLDRLVGLYCDASFDGFEGGEKLTVGLRWQDGAGFVPCRMPLTRLHSSAKVATPEAVRGAGAVQIGTNAGPRYSRTARNSPARGYFFCGAGGCGPRRSSSAEEGYCQHRRRSLKESAARVGLGPIFCLCLI
jgi:hypothetical protein